jgi:hypothetical protein
MVVEKCCASEFWRENNYSADNTTAIAVIFKTRPDPIDTPTKEAIQEKAEMDAAVAAAEKAMEGIGMPDDDEEEEAPKFRRNRSSGGGGSSELADSGSEAGSGVASEGKQLSAAERRQARRKAAEGGKKSVSFAEDIPME